MICRLRARQKRLANVQLVEFVELDKITQLGHVTVCYVS